MTKGELINLIDRFPDDMEIRMGIRKDSGTYTIDRANQYQNCDDHIDNFITLEPGCYVDEDERD